MGIPKRHIDDGFFLAYLLRFCSKVFGGHHRDYMLQEHHGHFDGYDIWANFAYENNSNPVHDHSGNFPNYVMPILALDVYDHAWVKQFGDSDKAKREYINVFSKIINWDLVSRRYDAITSLYS